MVSVRNVLFYLLATAFIAAETPHEWWKSKRTRFVLLLFYVLGYFSVTSLYLFFRDLEHGTFKTILSVCINVYYAFLTNAVILTIFRMSAHYIVKRTKIDFLYRIVFSRKVFFALILLFSTFYLVGGAINTTNFAWTQYSAEFPNSPIDAEMDIIEISDLHVGAGLHLDEVERAVDEIAQRDYDLVVVAGDIVDVTTNDAELTGLANALGRLHDVYFIEGNHDFECKSDCIPILEAAGSHYLSEPVLLENGVTLIPGNTYHEDWFSGTRPCITVRHIPNHLDSFVDQTDLVLMAHTHGYSYYFPDFYVSSPYGKFQYGTNQVGSTTFLTTSGLSGWGFRLKWPSKNEIVSVHVRFSK